jgi:radical SAM superfamily enzyme YgiQ (UPF0313 family)
MPTGLRVGYDEYFSSSPLGIETLAAHARKYCDVALADLRGSGRDAGVHAQGLLASSPDMVGISLNSAPHTNYTLELVRELKAKAPQLPIIVGGQQATFLDAELLAGGHVDAVIRSEGEQTLCEILERGGSFRGVQGVSWLRDGTLRREADRPLIEDLDQVLMPARDLLPDRGRYRMGEYRVEGIESSRGCPFHCSFCSIRNFHRGRWRKKSVQRVLAEIDDILARYPEPKVIYFADDNFSTDVNRVIEICRGIVERKTDAHFWCQARADQIARRPEVAEWMGKAHFAAVLMGIETPLPHLLESARKGTSVEQINLAISLLHKHDVGVWGTFTLGLPGESHADTHRTAKFIPKAKVDVAQITVATPIPGSDLYEQAKAGGMLDPNWDDYDFTSPTMPGQLPKSEMDALIQRAYLRVYLSLRFLASMFSKRTNLARLRRTALGVFWAWIWYIIRLRWRRLTGNKDHLLAPGEQAPQSEPGVQTKTKGSATPPVRQAP